MCMQTRSESFSAKEKTAKIEQTIPLRIHNFIVTKCDILRYYIIIYQKQK